MQTGGRAAAVVALKPFADAKSRLGDMPDALRRRLAWTMALDTLSALTSAVETVVVVSAEPALSSRLARAGVAVEVLDEPAAGGLNAALRHGADLLGTAGHDVVVACVGDLPALRPASVRLLVDAVPDGRRGYLPDSAGTGTTMLVARTVPLGPRFSGASAAAHRASGALDLSSTLPPGSVPDARQDVDTAADLAPAAVLGLGAATRALLRPGTTSLAEHVVVTTTDATDDRGWTLVVSASGGRLALATAALDDELQLLPGRRLQGVQADGVVLSAWP